ncbi:ParB N-terminal domain-containing protein [Campylobacter concisus]|uniref:site-specific DNA-methyltransferase n=1 Tax=Campylobacter concisus TaxID=199 RepID=UPI0018A9A094|nr:DNA methyltransferase [Campylobacter concisus]QPI00123.1 ParB N-terminal domain-containing protein [Campylobacter concisus]QPI01913.1 ParB N-terminal domain-containing protein [Campylobacter concisus]
MEIKYKKIGELTPYINNARTHSDEQVDQIVASIKEFGFTNPLLIDEKGEIIAGHGRLAAAKKLNMGEVPTIELKGLSEAQKRAYVIADNKLALNAGWDEDLLKAELEALQNLDFDLEFAGFSEDELEEMGLLGDGIEINTDKADDVPEIEEHPIIKQGDLIELGHNYQHRLLCGDSTDEASVNKLMNGKKADMVFTDPPYGVGYQGIKNDEPEQLERLLTKAFSNYATFTKQGAPIYVFHSDRMAHIFHNVFRDFCHFSSMIIWKKPVLVLSQTDYQSIHEPCMYGWLKGGTHKWNGDRKQISVWEYTPKKYNKHTTPKPVEMIEKAIFNSSKTKQIVLDLFLGSGSTMIACENLSRQCYGMELDEKYAQAIVQRYVDYTNNPKIKINGKEVDWYEYKEAANG